MRVGAKAAAMNNPALIRWFEHRWVEPRADATRLAVLQKWWLSSLRGGGATVMDAVTIVLSELAGLPPWGVLGTTVQSSGGVRSILRWGGPHGR